MDALLFPLITDPPKEFDASFPERYKLLEKENRALRLKLFAYKRRVAELEGREIQLSFDEFMAGLREDEAKRIAAEKARLEAAPKVPREKKKKFPGHGPTPQESLPKVEEVFELPPNDRQCPVCTGELVPLGQQFEESEDVHVIERTYVLRSVKRRKYRCTCNSCVITAPGPVKVIPGGRYSLDFAISAAADKYLDNIPLERQTRRMQRQGVDVTSQTLYDQFNAVARINDLTYQAIGRKIIANLVVHADETRWPRLDGKGLCNWTAWTRTTPELAHYAILEARSKSVARHLFEGFRGTLVVDGYQVYESLAKEPEILKRFKIANCWTHGRRKFEEIEDNFPESCAWMLKKISDLYDVEAKVPGPFPGSAEAQELRLKLRQDESKTILNEIKDWIENQVGLPRSNLGEAIRYLYKRWTALTLFLDNPLIPLDNNAAERALRGLVIGRKVHYGSKSKRGTEVAAVLYTLLESAKLCGVDPVAYLKASTLAGLESPPRVLLPQQFRDQLAEKALPVDAP